MNPLRLRPRRPPVGRIVVVDDEAPIHTLLTRFLHANGHEVMVASSADQAIELLRGVEADVVILDVRMPRRSGLDVLVFMRQEERLRQVPVVILTGARLTPNERRIVASNNARVIYKPDSLGTLADFVRELISTRGTRNSETASPS